MGEDGMETEELEEGGKERVLGETTGLGSQGMWKGISGMS